MFTWLRRWRHNRRRAIFQFWDGRTLRRVDPQIVWWKLKNHSEFNIETDPDFHDAGHRDATERCLAAIREAFGVTAFDGEKMTGLTEDETLGVYWQFGQWMADVKKNISPQPTSSPTSIPEPPNSTESSTAATSNSADCSLTLDAPSSAAPAP